MQAAWWEQNGPACEVLRLGEMPRPEPEPGEVLVRVAASGVNPATTWSWTTTRKNTPPSAA